VTSVRPVRELDDILAELNEAQCQAALANRGPVAILVGAGTGKTTTITHRIACQVPERRVRGLADPRRAVATAVGDQGTRRAVSPAEPDPTGRRPERALGLLDSRAAGR
jgi:hypothetical protein